jgi:hypothetical protein
VDGAGDADALALSTRTIAGRFVDVDRQSQISQHRGGLAAHATFIEKAEWADIAHQLLPEEQVARDAEIVCQGLFLVDPSPRRHRGPRSGC